MERRSYIDRRAVRRAIGRVNDAKWEALRAAQKKEEQTPKCSPAQAREVAIALEKDSHEMHALTRQLDNMSAAAKAMHSLADQVEELQAQIKAVGAGGVFSQYLLFAGDDYYPDGGANDLIGGFASVDAAVSAHDPKRFRYDGGWANILQVSTQEIVRTFDRGTWSSTETPVIESTK